MDIAVAASGGPGWTDILTAIGTVAAAVAAVGAAAVAVWIALWSDRRSEQRVKDEHARSDRLLGEERGRAKTALEDERRLALDREQFAEAYAVQVEAVYTSVGGKPDRFGDLDGSVRQLGAMVANHGSFTITEVEAAFALNARQLAVQPQRFVRVSGFASLPGELRNGWAESDGYAMEGVLTPRDAGIRFESQPLPVDVLENPFPVIRWRDRWGVRWEHKLGKVRRIRDDEPWEP